MNIDATLDTEFRTYVALLRGINVGGKNALPMDKLKEILSEQRCVDIQTYQQSGNAVFKMAIIDSAQSDESIADGISAAIESSLGLKVPVVLRRPNAFLDACKYNPYEDRGADHKQLHVGFLSGQPDPETVRQLDPERSVPDEFLLKGREIYLHLPNGMARTKLTNAYFDRVLGQVSTFRNRRTLSKLAEMLAG